MIEILEHSAAPEAASLEGDTRNALAVLVHRRSVPIALIVATIAVTMAYSLLWAPLFGQSHWSDPGDLWGTLRTAQFVAWGDIGGVYSSGGGLVSLPGISVVLAPVALLVSHLGLSVGFPFGLTHPTAWLVLGPYEALVGAIVLIPLDALAEELGVGRGARMASSICEAIVLWPVLVLWGHPEDTLAMAFAVWGLLASMRGRWRATGWLFGLAILMQPLVVLMVPIVLATAPRREWLKLALRGALPGAALVAIPLAQSWTQTTTALFKQPNYPLMDHPTPWLALAPVLSKTHTLRFPQFTTKALPNGGGHFSNSIVSTVVGETVAAGPGRLIAIGLSVLMGFYLYRHRLTFEQVVWMCCVALSLRCVFEAVMNPYYLWPPLAIALVLVAKHRWRFGLAVIASAALTVLSYRHTGPWEWWVPVVLLLGLVVVTAAPRRVATREVTVCSERSQFSAAQEPLVGAPI